MPPATTCCPGWRHECGAEFEARSRKAKLCPSCRLEKQREQSRQWKRDHPQRVREVGRTYRKRSNRTVVVAEREQEVEWDGRRYTRHDLAIILIKL